MTQPRILRFILCVGLCTEDKLMRHCELLEVPALW